MLFFKEPKHSYTDFYDIARFKSAWRVNIILCIGLFLISTFFSFFSVIAFIQYFSGFLISLTGLTYLFVTKRFIIVSYFNVIAALLLVISSMFFVRNNPHIIEPLWLIIIAIFAYFNLGKKVGHTVLAIISVSISFYFYFFLNQNETLQHPYSELQLIGLILEFSMCMFIIGYFIHIFINTTAHAEGKFRQANEELNEQYKMIRLQNEEKTVLLQEIHHRVKNNLQVITSLLRLQSAEIESEDAKVHFNDAINRVMTMSLIHQKMYQEKNLSQMDASDYFKTLIDDLIRSSSVQLPIQVNVTSNLDKVGSKTIVPLALLVAELVSNSMKHAFDHQGNIQITFSSNEDKQLKLTYEDNGSWKEQENKASFGLQLIETLTEQLDGEYSRNSTEKGTQYIFNLSNLDD